MYLVKTGRLIGQLLDNDTVRNDIFHIWKRDGKNNSDEDDLVYCLTPTSTITFNPVTGSVVSSINHPQFMKLPTSDDKVISVKVTFKSPELTNQPDRIYCVVKDDTRNTKDEDISKGNKNTERKRRKHESILTGYTTCKKKSYKFPLKIQTWT